MTSPYCFFSSKLLGYSTLLHHYCSGQGCKEIAFNASLVFFRLSVCWQLQYKGYIIDK